MDRDISVLYDVCVVGAGMIGSAAARHVSKSPGLKVCLIGPKEPEVGFGEMYGDCFSFMHITFLSRTNIVSCEPEQSFDTL